MRPLLAALVAIFVAETSTAGLNRFSQSEGIDPLNHRLEDFDRGIRRDFFRMDDGVWVERYGDGFIAQFRPNGRGKAQLPAGQIVDGDIVLNATGKTEYLIPDGFGEGSLLFYRSDSTMPFTPAGPMHLVGLDEESAFFLTARPDLAKLSDLVSTTLDSTPLEGADGDVHYKFKWMGGDHRVTYLENGRIHIIADAQGEINLPICNLGPDYLRLGLDFVPLVRAEGKTLEIAPTDPHAASELLDGSDTFCFWYTVLTAGIAAVIVPPAMHRIASSDLVKHKILDVLPKLTQPLDIDKITAGLDGPFSKPFLGKSLCIYPNPTAVRSAALRGTMADASVEIDIVAHPRAVIADTCDAPTPIQLSVISSRVPSGSRISADFVVAYSVLRQQLLGNPSLVQAGVNDVTFTPRQAYVTTILHRANGTQVSMNAIPILAIPETEGNVGVDVGFAKIPGDPAIAIKGLETLDLTDQVNHLRDSLQGTFILNDVRLDLVGPHLEDVVFICDADGIHAYLSYSVTARLASAH